MFGRKTKVLLTICVVLLVSGMKLYYNPTQIFFNYEPAPFNYVQSESLSLIEFRKIANETLSQNNNAPPFTCPEVSLYGLKFRLCCFPEQEWLWNNPEVGKNGANYKEGDKVGYVISLLRRLIDSEQKKDVVFVDLGTNVGAYSLPILLSGVKVVSLDAQWEAVRRFTLSLHLAHLNTTQRQRITILHNAVSNESGVMFHIAEPTSFESSAFVRKGLCSTSDCTGVKSTTLNSLLPLVTIKPSRFAMSRPQVVLKIDIEGGEPLAFKEPSAARFFEETDVVFVQSEWYWFQRYANASQVKEEMLTFFTQRGYLIHLAVAPWRPLTVSECVNGRFIEDIIFIKKDYESAYMG